MRSWAELAYTPRSSHRAIPPPVAGETRLYGRTLRAGSANQHSSEWFDGLEEWDGIIYPGMVVQLELEIGDDFS